MIDVGLIEMYSVRLREEEVIVEPHYRLSVCRQCR